MNPLASSDQPSSARLSGQRTLYDLVRGAQTGMDELKTSYDVVVGAGVIGTMTAKALAERGRQTLILERFQLAHKGGSSHGLSRIVRVYRPPLRIRGGWG